MPMSVSLLQSFAGLEQLAQSRLHPRGGVFVDQVFGSGLIQLFDSQAKLRLLLLGIVTYSGGAKSLDHRSER